MIRAPWVSHFGFPHTPFSKTIPASQLCERASLQEAVARIRFTSASALVGVLTGEVGVGKTVAVRAAPAALIAAASAGKAIGDDNCAKKAVAELTRD